VLYRVAKCRRRKEIREVLLSQVLAIAKMRDAVVVACDLLGHVCVGGSQMQAFSFLQLCW
jgi:hypothetical protein